MARHRYKGGNDDKEKTAAEKTYEKSTKGLFDTSSTTGANLPASFKGLFDTSTTTGVNKSPPPNTETGALKYLGKAGKKSQRRKSKSAKKRMTRRR